MSDADRYQKEFDQLLLEVEAEARWRGNAERDAAWKKLERLTKSESSSSSRFRFPLLCLLPKSPTLKRRPKRAAEGEVER